MKRAATLLAALSVAFAAAAATVRTATETFVTNRIAAAFTTNNAALVETIKATTPVYTETDPTISAWAKAATKPTYTAAEVGAWNLDGPNETEARSQSIRIKSGSGETLGSISLGLSASGPRLYVSDTGVASGKDPSSVAILPSRISVVNGDVSVNVNWADIITRAIVQQVFYLDGTNAELPVSSAALQNFWEVIASPEVWDALDTKADLDTVQTTISDALAPYAKKEDVPTVPTKVSAFENDAGYVKKESSPVVMGGGATGVLGAVSLGVNADASDPSGLSVAIGSYSVAGMGATAIGFQSSATDQGSTSVGSNTRSHGAGSFNINQTSLEQFYFGDATLGSLVRETISENVISHTNPAFSNAVLAVGLSIDTNSVAVLNEIASTFGGFPIEGTATTVGGLLAALAAAAAWLKKNKADKATPSASAALLADNAVAVVDGSAGGEVAVSFKAPSGNALRYCELMLTGVASDGAATLVLPAGTYQFADGADSVPKGNSHFCFAEYARGKWLVTRQSTTEKAVEEAGA